MKRVDLDKFLRSVVEIKNADGSRDYERGLRLFDCPLCGERNHNGRGWLGTTHFGAGCFNPGCVANPELSGGAIEWCRRVLGLVDRAATWATLREKFGTEVPLLPPVLDIRGDDWCRMPMGRRAFVPVSTGQASPLQDTFARFIETQWGLSIADAMRWDLGWTVVGRHGWRVIIPVKMGGRVIGFQTRTVKQDVEPKYLTSAHGLEWQPEAECGRPAAAMLFNVDAIRVNQEALMVEGAGDVMGWCSRAGHGQLPAFGLLGLTLTRQKLALIKTAHPRRVIVAPDAGEVERRRALDHIDDLRAWGVEAVFGEWIGGKDAGSGARLAIEEGPGGSSFAAKWQTSK